MSLSKAKISIIILFFVSLLVISVHADFCSQTTCSCYASCKETCDGSYWLYGSATCSSSCSSEGKYCSFSNRVCADSDASDGVPKIGCKVVTCGAQCDQDSDCSCQANGCVGQDYYTYQGVCNSTCNCECKASISTNDSRCVVCDPSNVDCNNPACSSDIQCLPCDTNIVNCSVPACANNTQCAPCDTSNVNCSIVACSNNTQCLPCDTSNVDCSIAACASNPTCTPAPPQTGGGGGTIISGGYIQPVTTPVSVCGDGICSSNETCSSCPKDCLNESEVCCDGLAYVGNCCINSDCSNGYECVGKKCQPLSNVTKAVCKEDWICQDWTECSNGAQMRVCVDKNNCGTIHERPDLVERCNIVSSTSPITGIYFFQPSAVVYGIILAVMSVLLLMLYLSRRKQTTKPDILASDAQTPDAALPQSNDSEI